MTDALQLAQDLFDSSVTAHADSKRDVTAKAVQLLALATREAFPDAVTLHFEDSDQGDWLDLSKVVLADGEEVAGYDDDDRWETLSDGYNHIASWLYPVGQYHLAKPGEDVPGFTWEKDRRDNTTDAHINIEEALK